MSTYGKVNKDFGTGCCGVSVRICCMKRNISLPCQPGSVFDLLRWYSRLTTLVVKFEVFSRACCLILAAFLLRTRA